MPKRDPVPSRDSSSTSSLTCPVCAKSWSSSSSTLSPPENMRSRPVLMNGTICHSASPAAMPAISSMLDTELLLASCLLAVRSSRYTFTPVCASQ